MIYWYIRRIKKNMLNIFVLFWRSFESINFMPSIPSVNSGYPKSPTLVMLSPRMVLPSTQSAFRLFLTGPLRRLSSKSEAFSDWPAIVAALSRTSPRSPSHWLICFTKALSSIGQTNVRKVSRHSRTSWLLPQCLLPLILARTLSSIVTLHVKD